MDIYKHYVKKEFIENITHDICEINGTLNHIISWNTGSIAMHNENRKKNTR